MSARRALILGIFLTGSTAALADPTTLVCNIHFSNATPYTTGRVDLDEAQGSITVYYPPSDNPGGQPDPIPGRSLTYAAKFSPNTIDFFDGYYKEQVTIDRVTGTFTVYGILWTCQVGQKKF